jgi:hypothetical protein
MSQMVTISDARAYCYQDQGHTFYMIYFPSAVPDPINGGALKGVGATWCYDVATQLWHQRGFWDTNYGRYTAHRSQCYCFAFGKHLVGDWQSGAIYEMNINFQDDAGAAMRWERRGPYTSAMASQQPYEYFGCLLVDVEVGLGLDGPPLWVSATGYNPGQGVSWNGLKNYVSVQGANFNHQPDTSPLWWSVGDPAGLNPQMTMQFSNDSGKTWSNERSVSCGRIGEFSVRVPFRQLGRALKGRRVFKIFGSDPVPYRITDADLQMAG